LLVFLTKGDTISGNRMNKKIIVAIFAGILAIILLISACYGGKEYHDHLLKGKVIAGKTWVKGEVSDIVKWRIFPRTGIGFIDKFSDILAKDGSKIDQRFGIEVYGILSEVKMKEANEYIRWINETWRGYIPKLDASAGFMLKGRYKNSPNSGIYLGGEFFLTQIRGEIAVYTFEMRSSVTGFPIGFFVEYPVGILTLGMELETGYYQASYVEKENSWQQRGSDSSWSYRISMMLRCNITRNFSFLTKAGYRGLKMDDFGIHFIKPGEPPVEMDYSGWFTMIGIMYSW
jgi:hypothetical protein